MTDIIQTVTLRTGKVWMRADGIIQGVITIPGTDQTIEDAIELIEAVKYLSNGRRCPVLSDVRNVVSVDQEARVFLAEGEHTSLISANAIIVESYLNKMIANFYLHINKPRYPMRMFNSKEEALQWLSGFVS